jgi:hypothetical protein
VREIKIEMVCENFRLNFSYWFFFDPTNSTYQQVFVQMMLVLDLVYHLIILHHNNHHVVPHFPKLTDNPLHIMLVLLLILQHCNFDIHNFHLWILNNYFREIERKRYVCVKMLMKCYSCRNVSMKKCVFKDRIFLRLLWWIIRKSSNKNATSSFPRNV